MAGKRPVRQYPTVPVRPLAGPLHRPGRLLRQGPAHLRGEDRRRSLADRPPPRDQRRLVEPQRSRPHRSASPLVPTRPPGWANRQVSGRPIKARTASTTARFWTDHLSDFDTRQLAAIKPKDVREWYERTLVDRPTMRSHAYSLLRTIMASAVNEELWRGESVPITGAGRSKRRSHKIRPASSRSSVCSPRRCPNACS